MANLHIYAPLQKLAVKTTLTIAAFSAAGSVAAQDVVVADNTAADQSPATGKIPPDLIVRAPDQFMAALEKIAGMPVLPVDLSGLNKPGPVGEPAIKQALQQAAAARGWDVADTQNLLHQSWIFPVMRPASQVMAIRTRADQPKTQYRNPHHFSGIAYYLAGNPTALGDTPPETKRVCIIGMDAPWHAPSPQVDQIAGQLQFIAGAERSVSLPETVLKNTLRSFILLHEASHCNRELLHRPLLVSAYDQIWGRISSSETSLSREAIHSEIRADSGAMAALNFSSFPDFPQLWYSYRTINGIFSSTHNTQFAAAAAQQQPAMTVPQIVAAQREVNTVVKQTLIDLGRKPDLETTPHPLIAAIVQHRLTDGTIRTPAAQLYARHYLSVIESVFHPRQLPPVASQPPFVAEPASPAPPASPALPTAATPRRSSRSAPGGEGSPAP